MTAPGTPLDPQTGGPAADRVRRIKLLTAGVALAGTAAGGAWEGWRFGAGVLAGGAVVLLNLLGTEVAARKLVAPEGPRWPALLLHLGKFALLAAAVAALLLTRAVSAPALLLGLGAFPVAAVLDLLLSPADDAAGKGGGKEGSR